MKLQKFWKQKWLLTQYYWRWLWMSRADRKRAKAMRKLLFNVLSDAPIETIISGESCAWSITPKQEQGAIEGLQQYVKAVTGEDIQVAKSTRKKTKDSRTNITRSSNGG